MYGDLFVLYIKSIISFSTNTNLDYATAELLIKSNYGWNDFRHNTKYISTISMAHMPLQIISVLSDSAVQIRKSQIHRNILWNRRIQSAKDICMKMSVDVLQLM